MIRGGREEHYKQDMGGHRGTQDYKEVRRKDAHTLNSFNQAKLSFRDSSAREANTESVEDVAPEDRSRESLSSN